MKPQVITLPNGVPLAIMEMPTMESVSVGVFVDIGSRHDPAPLSGLAHFAEHLFFKGTANRTARELSIATEANGGGADAFTSEEHTCFYLRSPAEEFDAAAEILLDMFINSTFPAAEVEREREVISEEISMYYEQPASRAEDLLCQLMWPKHPLGRSISGDEKSLRRISRAHLVNHTKAHYGKKNIVLAVAGKVDAKHAAATLTKLLGNKLGSGKRPTYRPEPRLHFEEGPRLHLEIRENIEQTQLAIGFHAPGRDKLGSAEVLRILNIILGENTSSRLWQELREKRGWCYQVETEATLLSDTGVFQIYVGVDPDNAEKALGVIWSELRRLTKTPVPKAELQRAISYAIGSSRLSLESTSSYMTWIGESMLFHREVTDLATAQDRLRKVTSAQIQELAQELFTPENLGLALVGPKADEHKLFEALEE
jgi:predicted Zn-dependent peptidase